MCESSQTRVACAALMLFAAAVLLFGPAPASAEQDEVPVFLLGSDGGLSSFVMWRDSKEFREVVFPSMAEALARVGIRAMGEEPFRARFNVDGVAGDSSSRWDCPVFVHFAPQVPVDDAGKTAQYVVCIDVWLVEIAFARLWRQVVDVHVVRLLERLQRRSTSSASFLDALLPGLRPHALARRCVAELPPDAPVDKHRRPPPSQDPDVVEHASLFADIDRRVDRGPVHHGTSQAPCFPFRFEGSLLARARCCEHRDESEQHRSGPAHHVLRKAIPAPLQNCPGVWSALTAPTSWMAMRPPAASCSCRSVACTSRVSGLRDTRCSS